MSLLGEVSIVTIPFSPALLNAIAIISPNSLSLLVDITETSCNIFSSTGFALFVIYFITSLANLFIPDLISLNENSSPLSL